MTETELVEGVAAGVIGAMGAAGWVAAMNRDGRTGLHSPTVSIHYDRLSVMVWVIGDRGLVSIIGMYEQVDLEWEDPDLLEKVVGAAGEVRTRDRLEEAMLEVSRDD